ncbi:hypothetical protein GGR54DRAFT_619508 [Hypoxylon sp. NC1633]|nr:hypothetical protein GGR54DRAFT_619508 [Hypoxylon sp. NC1633]
MGHYKNECKSPQRQPKVPEPAAKARTVAGVKVTMIRTTSHALTNWTNCHDDNCQIHLSDKQGSGHFPLDSEEEDSSNDGCVCEGVPIHPLYPQACAQHPTTERSQEAISKGCMCYAPVLCDLYEDIALGIFPNNKKSKDKAPSVGEWLQEHKN